MGSVLSPLLLLFLQLVLTPGLAPTPTLAQDCDAADIVVEAGETRLIHYAQDVQYVDNENPYSLLYPTVKLEPGFTGLHLQVTGSDGEEYLAWFPKDSECFPHNDTWYGLFLGAGIHKYTNTLHLGYGTSTCKRECMINPHPKNFRNFAVVAYGPSKWLLGKPPPSCDYREWTHSPPTLAATCEKPPTSESTTLETPSSVGPSVPVLVVVAAVLLTVALVLVVQTTVKFICRIWRQQQQSTTLSEARSPPQQPADQTHNHNLPSTPRTVDVRREIDGYIYYEQVNLPAESPQATESHAYDSVYIYDDVATTAHGVTQTQAAASGKSDEVPVYENIAKPPLTEEPVYEVVR